MKEVTIEIPHRLHNSMIGAKGRLIRAIMEECGGVLIRFPPEGAASDKVTIRGPKEDVENARKQLLELENEKVREIIHKVYCNSFIIIIVYFLFVMTTVKVIVRPLPDNHHTNIKMLRNM